MFSEKMMMTNNVSLPAGSGYWSAPGAYTFQSAYPSIPALSQRFLMASVNSPGTISQIFSTTGYTLEYWFYATSYDGLGQLDGTGYGFTAGPQNRDFGTSHVGVGGWGFGPLEDGKIVMDLHFPTTGSDVVTFVQANATFPLNTWTNLCVTFTPVGTGGLTSEVRMFINGVQTNVRYFQYGHTPGAYSSYVTAFCVGGIVPSGDKFIFGLNGTNQTWAGYMDELRISNIVRYTSSYTPATSEFTTDSNTQLLMHFSGNNGSTVFNDSSNAFGTGTGGFANQGQLPVTISNSNIVF